MTPKELATKMTQRMKEAVQKAESDHHADHELPQNIKRACKNLVLEGKETARLVALTNVAGCSVDPEIPADLLQAQAGGVDFRSLYKKSTKKVLTELAAEAEVKWSPSSDPYVSNPYRELKINAEWVLRRGNKLPGADSLYEIVQAVQADTSLAFGVLVELFGLELNRLQSQKIVYRIPPRLTVSALSSVMAGWLDDGMGGKRLETAAVALLRYVGVVLGGKWGEVVSHHVNDPTPFDAMCKRGSKPHTLAEVKDQKVTLDFLVNLADQMVEHEASRGLLLTRSRWLPTGEDAEEIEGYLKGRALLGLRIEIVDIDTAISSWLALLDTDDDSLPNFLHALTEELDSHGELADRVALATTLRDI